LRRRERLCEGKNEIFVTRTGDQALKIHMKEKSRAPGIGYFRPGNMKQPADLTKDEREDSLEIL
jgi:hypothetical protein